MKEKPTYALIKELEDTEREIELLVGKRSQLYKELDRRADEEFDKEWVSLNQSLTDQKLP